MLMDLRCAIVHEGYFQSENNEDFYYVRGEFFVIWLMVLAPVSFFLFKQTSVTPLTLKK